MCIGLKIKELCKKENLSLTDLAKKLHKTRPAVAEMVEKQDVNTAILRECSIIFNVPISFFFAEEDISTLIDMKEKLSRAESDIKALESKIVHLEKENMMLQSGKQASTKVIVELDVTADEFIKMGLKEKVIQIINTKE